MPTPESDFQILNLASALYHTLSLKRVFFSAYLPVSTDKRLPESGVQLNREHRLYQADWLMRFYKFDAAELIDEAHPFLDPQLDPKANWALNHLECFPVEVNTANLETLLRVPGLGPAWRPQPHPRPTGHLPTRNRIAPSWALPSSAPATS